MLKHLALLIGTGCACCLAVVAAGLILSDRAARGNLINEVRLETGSVITVDSFFEAAPEDAAIVTDVSGIDTSVPGTYPLVISYGGKEEDVTLTISDTTAPDAVAVPQSIYIGTDIPAPEAFAELPALPFFTGRRPASEPPLQKGATPSLNPTESHDADHTGNPISRR